MSDLNGNCENWKTIIKLAGFQIMNNNWFALVLIEFVVPACFINSLPTNMSMFFFN